MFGSCLLYTHTHKLAAPQVQSPNKVKVAKTKCVERCVVVQFSCMYQPHQSFRLGGKAPQSNPESSVPVTLHLSGMPLHWVWSRGSTQALNGEQPSMAPDNTEQALLHGSRVRHSARIIYALDGVPLLKMGPTRSACVNVFEGTFTVSLRCQRALKL